MKTVIFLFFNLIISCILQAQVVVTRGPYIQMLGENNVVIKWRTNTATSSRVIYGLSQASLINTVSETANTTEHEVEITGLAGDTKYYYSIGNATDLLSASAQQFFYTMPPVNTSREYNFWVVGDCGTANDDQRFVRNAFQNYIGNTRIYGMIMLGDNAYTLGTDGEYQGALFNNMYEDIISNTPMWPTPGNHDYYSGADATTQTGPYYDIFTLPKLAQFGGVASNTEAYYSYNIGNIHFISIDSFDSGRDSTNAMGNWIKQDLQNNHQEWTVAYWHHAPYTKGNHDSDNPFPWLDGELPEMREQILPLLERGGVDLILCGHSHSYERSMFINGHYGSSGSFNSSHQIDAGSGDFITDCPYIKNTEQSVSNQGTVYTVLGVSGKKSGPGSGWPHPIMHSASTDHLGSMILTVKDNRLDAKFLTSTNTIFDQFSIIKNAGGKQTVYVCQGDEITLKPSFATNQYTWNPSGINATELTLTPFFSSYYFGSDPMGCIKDTFQISVIQPGSPLDTCDWTAGILDNNDPSFQVYPTINSAGSAIQIKTEVFNGEKITLEWLDMNGKKIQSFLIPSGTHPVTVPENLLPGIYLIRAYFNNKFHIQKIIIN